MVEYRRRPPPGGPPPGPSRRPEPEPPEEAPEGGTTQRRAYASPWRRPRLPEAEEREPEYGRGRPPQLWEVLVPEWERGKEFFEPGAPFQFTPPGARLPLFPGAPGERPAAARPGARPPARRKGEPPVVDPRNWFRVEQIWDAIRRARAHPQFPKGVPVSMDKVTPPAADEASRRADVMRRFGIPREEADRHPGQTFWTVFLPPFLDELAYAFNYAKPPDIPGEVGFQDGPDGSIRLSYMER